MEPDVYEEVSKVRDKVADLEISMTKKMGELETTTHVTKHKTANLEQMIMGISSRFDRFEAQFQAELKSVASVIGVELKAIREDQVKNVQRLTDEMKTINTKADKSGWQLGAIVTGILLVFGGLVSLATTLLQKAIS
jgi:hypothetical protein